MSGYDWVPMDGYKALTAFSYSVKDKRRKKGIASLRGINGCRDRLHN